MDAVLDVSVIERVPTGIEGAEKSDDFMVTKSALKMIQEVKEQNEVPEDYFLRIGSHSGGCSGMRYDLGFDSEANENDRVLEINDLKIVVDSHSLFYVQGITLDYMEGAHGVGFTFNNPNNSHNCGCGG